MNAPNTAAPTRLALAFLAAKSRLLTALKDEGGLFECRFLARLLERERTEVSACTTEAESVNAGVTDLRQLFLRDFADGIMDEKERQEYLAQLRSLGTATRHHAGHLEQLT